MRRNIRFSFYFEHLAESPATPRQIPPASGLLQKRYSRDRAVKVSVLAVPSGTCELLLIV